MTWCRERRTAWKARPALAGVRLSAYAGLYAYGGLSAYVGLSAHADLYAYAGLYAYVPRARTDPPGAARNEGSPLLEDTARSAGP